MKLRQGPRPWSIRVFAILFVASGLVGLISGLLNIDQMVELFTYDIPTIQWSADLVIVLLSAIFTIVLIPVVAVWFFASRIARVLVTLFASLSLLQLGATIWMVLQRRVDDWTVLLDPAVIVIAVTMLFTPSARGWFSKKEINPATFG